MKCAIYTNPLAPLTSKCTVYEVTIRHGKSTLKTNQTKRSKACYTFTKSVVQANMKAFFFVFFLLTTDAYFSLKTSSLRIYRITLRLWWYFGHKMKDFMVTHI